MSLFIAFIGLKDKKSPGYDLITGRVLKELPNKGIKLITHLQFRNLRLRTTSCPFGYSKLITVALDNERIGPSLFAMYIGDMEEVLRRNQSGGIVVGRKKVWVLAYADDVVLVAREENEIRSMIRAVKKYMERIGLEVNTKKAKMGEFQKKRGRGKRAI